MCGIVGFITTEKHVGALDRKRWFINALRAGVVRGDDGTGVFLVPHDAKTESADWCKMGAAPEKFFEDPHTISRLGVGNDFNQYRAVIGHNRSATIGSVSTANAHPFQEGAITLVHNGTLNSTHNLPMPKYKTKGADVDSHVICHNLATHPVAEVVKELDGAYVLVWHDARDQSLNIIRNDRRPLHILPLKHHKTLLLASEAEMLWWLTQRSSFIPEGKIYYPEPGHLLSFTPEGGIKPKVTKLEMFSYRGHVYTGRTRAWTSDDYDDDESTSWYNRVNNTEGPNMGKGGSGVTAGPHINQHSLNRKIPRPLSKTLDTVGLHYLDKLRMGVVQVQEIPGTKNALVIGRLVDLPGTPTAHLYGLLYEAVKPAEGKELWTVAPCGVKMMAFHGLRVVIARLLARSASVGPLPPTDHSEQQSSPSSQEDSSTEDGEDELWEAMTAEEQHEWLAAQTYYDVAGTEITLKEWLNLTASGCSLCKGQIEPEEADDMIWDLDTKLPICGECRFELEEDGNIDYSEAV